MHLIQAPRTIESLEVTNVTYGIPDVTEIEDFRVLRFEDLSFRMADLGSEECEGRNTKPPCDFVRSAAGGDLANDSDERGSDNVSDDELNENSEGKLVSESDCESKGPRKVEVPRRRRFPRTVSELDSLNVASSLNHDGNLHRLRKLQSEARSFRETSKNTPAAYANSRATGSSAVARKLGLRRWLLDEPLLPVKASALTHAFSSEREKGRRRVPSRKLEQTFSIYDSDLYESSCKGSEDHALLWRSISASAEKLRASPSAECPSSLLYEWRRRCGGGSRWGELVGDNNPGKGPLDYYLRNVSPYSASSEMFTDAPFTSVAFARMRQASTFAAPRRLRQEMDHTPLTPSPDSLPNTPQKHFSRPLPREIRKNLSSSAPEWMPGAGRRVKAAPPAESQAVQLARGHRMFDLLFPAEPPALISH